ncbi:CGNR zinc finger domain-containing protein [Symbioplanes lichenis]|uniref:CGNR zinc finger domain-containing protein n=1 Tax=Symbioplanes lichenis TaxID=1629072 RepID=UPI002739B1BA|nr:CGNR zinc finger domain-containing protein [Actinoplanes lichenis]
MQLNPYGADAVRLAVALANERPATPEALAERCRAAGLLLDGPPGEDDLIHVKSMLDDWEAVVDAGDDETRAARLNAMLAAAAAYPRLTSHGGGWHLHYRDEGRPLGAVLHALVAVGTAFHLAGRGMHRLRRCAAGNCSLILADLSRTGRQRYCSTRCANRDAVRRHRSRRAL